MERFTVDYINTAAFVAMAAYSPVGALISLGFYWAMVTGFQAVSRQHD